jgi:hypothetical protein
MSIYSSPGYWNREGLETISFSVRTQQIFILMKTDRREELGEGKAGREGRGGRKGEGRGRVGGGEYANDVSKF